MGGGDGTFSPIFWRREELLPKIASRTLGIFFVRVLYMTYNTEDDFTEFLL